MKMLFRNPTFCKLFIATVAMIEPIMMLGHSLALGAIALAFPVWLSVTWLHYMLAFCTVGVSFFYLKFLSSLVRKRSVQAAAEEAISD